MKRRNVLVAIIAPHHANKVSQILPGREIGVPVEFEAAAQSHDWELGARNRMPGLAEDLLDGEGISNECVDASTS